MRLDHLLEELAKLQSQLMLLVGPPGCGKSALLRELANLRSMTVMNVGALLGRRLASMAQRERALHANVAMRALIEEYAAGDILLFDNLELLFDRTLRLDPLDLLKRYSHVRRVVAVWPGELREGRLIYAEMGHPEYQDYGLDGLVPFEIESLG